MLNGNWVYLHGYLGSTPRCFGVFHVDDARRFDAQREASARGYVKVHFSNMPPRDKR